MKIDTHVHSNGISKCSHVNFTDIAIHKKAAGVDGAILTNHCQPWYYKGPEFKDWIKSYIDEFDRAYAFGKQTDFKFFQGIEVSISEPFYADYLLIGTSDGFLLSAPDFCRLSQRELYKLCNENGVLLFQAHPLRSNFDFADARFLDGVEINLRSSDRGTKDGVIQFAEKHNLFISAGTDYHDLSQDDLSGGIIVPDNVQSSEDIAKFIRSENKTEVFIGDEISVFTRR